jgi:phenylacetate-CoA ligase
MIDIDQINTLRVGKITFPMTNYLYNRRKITQSYKGLLESERLPQEVLQGIQLDKLKKILAFAQKHVPFYQRKFKGLGLDIRGINDLKDVRNIPPLSRSEVIDHHKEMVDRRFAQSIPNADNRPGDPGTPIQFARFKKHKLVRNTSSGSTGAPTIFYEDGSRTALNWVHELRLKQWFGVEPCAKEARLVRLSVDYNLRNRMVYMRRLLWNQLLLPGTNLADADYSLSLKAILEFKPKVLWGFPSALSGLAEYILRTKQKLNGYKPVVAIGWAGPVYDHEEKNIKEAFGCAVSNNYGAREVGHIAGRCPQGAFHINQENHFVEIEPRNDIDRNHEVGEILVSSLDPSPMPFIRYRMGDIGKVCESNCSCGRTLLELSGFMGRTGEIFISKDGRMISPNFWCRFFFANHFSNAIRRFQVIYKKDKNLKIIIERDTNYDKNTENYIKQGILKNFSSETELDLVYVEKIEPQISGKYKMVMYEAV